MNTSLIIVTTFFCLFLLIFILTLLKRNTTDTTIVQTTTTESQHLFISGSVTKFWENGQPFVYDPADRSKTYVNTHDDMYEDAIGQIWEII